MSELRWTLLILGVVFILALSWWERRRPRQAFAPRLRDASLSQGDAHRIASAEPPAAAEPWIGETGLSDFVSSEMSFTDADEDGEPSGDSDIRADEERSIPGPLEELPTLVIPAEDERLALEAAWNEQPPEPRLIDPEASTTGELPVPFTANEPSDAAELHDPEEFDDAEGDATALRDAIPPVAAAATRAPAVSPPVAAVATRAPAVSPPVAAAATRVPAVSPPVAAAATRAPAVSPPVAAVSTQAPAAGPVEGAATPARAATPAEPEIAGAEGVGAVRIVEPAFNGDGTPPPEPIVEWPPEDSRRILALRLVAPQARFPGRTLRLALAAEGFLLGKFSIFHKPDEANRAVLSAASLNRPGAFDLETMDSQRYAGLSLFAVLPGPRTPQQTFEELLTAARNLNERLEGALQDERGGPLTPLRVQSIRESVRADTATLPPAAAAHGG